MRCNYIGAVCLPSAGRGHFPLIHSQCSVATPTPSGKQRRGRWRRHNAIMFARTPAWTQLSRPTTTSLTDAPGNDTKRSLLEASSRLGRHYEQRRVVSRSTGRAIAARQKPIGMKLRAARSCERRWLDYGVVGRATRRTDRRRVKTVYPWRSTPDAAAAVAPRRLRPGAAVQSGTPLLSSHCIVTDHRRRRWQGVIMSTTPAVRLACPPIQAITNIRLWLSTVLHNKIFPLFSTVS